MERSYWRRRCRRLRQSAPRSWRCRTSSASPAQPDRSPHAGDHAVNSVVPACIIRSPTHGLHAIGEHRQKGLLTLKVPSPLPWRTPIPPGAGPASCHSRLGGLVKFYHRAAAHRLNTNNFQPNPSRQTRGEASLPFTCQRTYQSNPLIQSPDSVFVCRHFPSAGFFDLTSPCSLGSSCSEALCEASTFLLRVRRSMKKRITPSMPAGT